MSTQPARSNTAPTRSKQGPEAPPVRVLIPQDTGAVSIGERIARVVEVGIVRAIDVLGPELIGLFRGAQDAKVRLKEEETKQAQERTKQEKEKTRQEELRLQQEQVRLQVEELRRGSRRPGPEES